MGQQSMGEEMVLAATPAATVVPLRDGSEGLEVLLLRRATGGAFSGMWVFPGGTVEPFDQPDEPAQERLDVSGQAQRTSPTEPTGPTELSEPTELIEPGALVAARRAAVREAREEAALELAEDDLVTLSFWLPPESAERRFATWFFLAPTGDQGDVVVDRSEIHEHRWLTPAAAFAARDNGEIGLVPPTFMTLWWLSQFADTASALAAARSRVPERFHTRAAFDADGRMRFALWQGDAGYVDGDATRPGRRRRLLMAPSGWRAEVDV